MRKNSAFTLIELLIVVAIIAILAAIAVPNFLEAQTRSKISRTKSDLRSIATAYEAYAVDFNKYTPGMWLNASDLANPYRWQHGHIPYRLTTPVAYITSSPTDPFADKGFNYNGNVVMDVWARTYRVAPRKLSAEATQYTETDWTNNIWPIISNGSTNQQANYILTGVGPDRIEDLIPAYHTRLDGGGTYDPTNGTLSKGDISWVAGGGK